MIIIDFNIWENLFYNIYEIFDIKNWSKDWEINK